MATINTPRYPVISWITQVTGQVTFTYDPDGAPVSETYELSDIVGTSRYGFSNNIDETCAVDSIQAAFAAALKDFFTTNVGLAAVVGASYNWTLPGWPCWQINLVNSFASPSEIEFDSIETARQLGFDRTTIEIGTGGLQSIKSDFNSVGYWAPHQLTVYDDRWSTLADVYVSSSPFASEFKTVRWGEDRDIRLLTFPFVRPVYMYQYRASDTSFAAPSGTDVNDPNNLYERVIQAARRNNLNNASTTFRIYSGANKYRVGHVVDPSDLMDTSNSHTAVSGRGTYYEVKFKVVDGEGN